MPLHPSKRLREHVVFHCPCCFADRLGAQRDGVWTPWPGQRVATGAYIECRACQAQTSG